MSSTGVVTQPNNPTHDETVMSVDPTVNVVMDASVPIAAGARGGQEEQEQQQSSGVAITLPCRRRRQQTSTGVSSVVRDDCTSTSSTNEQEQAEQAPVDKAEQGLLLQCTAASDEDKATLDDPTKQSSTPRQHQRAARKVLVAQHQNNWGAVAAVGDLPTFKNQVQVAPSKIKTVKGDNVMVVVADPLPGFKDQVRPSPSRQRRDESEMDPPTTPNSCAVIPSAVGQPVDTDPSWTTAMNEIPVVAVLDIAGANPSPSSSSAIITTSRGHIMTTPTITPRCYYSPSNKCTKQHAGLAAALVLLLLLAVAVVVVWFNPAVPRNATVSTAASSPGNVSSTFDFQTSNNNNNDDGWTLGGDGVDLQWHSPGYISGTDGLAGEPWYFVAPSKFHGSLIGCHLSFELKQQNINTTVEEENSSTTTTSEMFRGPPLVVGSTAATSTTSAAAARIAFRESTYFNSRPSPTSRFTKFELVFHVDDYSWMLDPVAASAEPATASKDTVEKILAHVDYLAIRGEYRAGEDSGSLDNVYLSC